MKVFLNAQAHDHSIKYKFEKDKIIATMNEVTDTFDFSGFKHGDVIEDTENDIKSKFEFSPILEVYRDNLGVLHVVLINWYNQEEKTEEELQIIWNPSWMEV